MCGSKKHNTGETHDATSRFCRPRLRHLSVSTGHACCAGSGAGHHHASRLRMRTGHDAGCWCLRGKDHQASSPQVYSLDGRRLRRVALLLRGRAITARNVIHRCGPFRVRFWRDFEQSRAPRHPAQLWSGPRYSRLTFPKGQYFPRRFCGRFRPGVTLPKDDSS